MKERGRSDDDRHNGEGPKKGADHNNAPDRDPGSHYIASLIKTIRDQGDKAGLACAQALLQEPNLTSGQFGALVSQMTDPEMLKALAHGFLASLLEELDLDIFDGLEALVALNHNLVILEGRGIAAARAEVGAVFEIYTEVLTMDSGIRAVVQKGLPPMVRDHLEEALDVGSPSKNHHWSALQFLCALYPDKRSLEVAFKVSARAPEDAVRTLPLESFQSAVSLVSNASFFETFDFVAARPLPVLTEPSYWFYYAALLGVAEHLSENIQGISWRISEGSDEQCVLACRVCMVAGNDESYGLSAEIRDELSNVLAAVVTADDGGGRSPRYRDLALRALAHISTSIDDVNELYEHILELRDSGEEIKPEMLWSYATSMSRLLRVEPALPLSPAQSIEISPLALQAIPRGEGVNPPSDSVAKVPDQFFEGLAFDLAEERKKKGALELCRGVPEGLDLRKNNPRSSDSIGMFFKDREAAAFAVRHAFLCWHAPTEIVAALLPEVLSALQAGMESKNLLNRVKIFDSVKTSFDFLAAVAARDEGVRDACIARLSVSDVEVLRALHIRDGRGKLSAPPSVVGAAIALRAAIEDSTTWQGDLLRWARELSRREAAQLDEGALDFVSVVGENRQAGSAWKLISQVPLVEFDGELFAMLATGLMSDPDHLTASILEGLRSEKGAVLSRSLLLAQLGADQMTDDQKAEALKATHGLLDEFGALGMDALVTFSCLASSKEEALEALSLEHVGIDPYWHLISKVHAAERILRNGPGGDGNAGLEVLMG